MDNKNKIEVLNKIERLRLKVSFNEIEEKNLIKLSKNLENLYNGYY